MIYLQLACSSAPVIQLKIGVQFQEQREQHKGGSGGRDSISRDYIDRCGREKGEKREKGEREKRERERKKNCLNVKTIMM